LRIIFDNKSNKFIKLNQGNDIVVHLKSYQNKGNTFNDEQFIYMNPHKSNLYEVSKSKKNLNEHKEKFTPLIR
jgi:hypothetical protein